MPEPITYASTTTQFGLPLLFSGQSQKEFYVNQSFVTIDALLSQSVTASQDAPPANPEEGESYRITSPASGVWIGHEDQLAIFVSGTWQYIEPANGLVLYDRSIGQRLYFNGSWTSAASTPSPTGGSVIEVEARATIDGLISSLIQTGILPPST